MGRVVKRSGIVRKYIRNIKIGRINWCALFFVRIIFPRHINIFIALASSRYELCLHRNSTSIRGVIQGVYESGYTSASAMRASADTHIGRLRETRAGSSSEMRELFIRPRINHKDIKLLDISSTSRTRAENRGKSSRSEIKQDGWRLHVLRRDPEKNVAPDASRAHLYKNLIMKIERESTDISHQDKTRWIAHPRPTERSPTKTRNVRPGHAHFLLRLSLHFAQLSWESHLSAIAQPRIHLLRRFATTLCKFALAAELQDGRLDVTRIYRGLAGKKIHHDTFDLD